MERSVTLRDEPARTVVYLHGEGTYTSIPEAIAALQGCIRERRLTPAGPPIAVFFNAPNAVAPEALRWEVRMPIVERATEAHCGAEFPGVKVVDARQLAVALHTGSFETVGGTYGYVQHWLGEHGFDVVGPTEEAYLSDPAEVPPEELHTEVRFPVVRIPRPIAR